MISDRNGGAVVSCSPEPERWARYKDFYALQEDCRLFRLDPRGVVRGSWDAPGPLRPGLGLGRGGEIFAVSEGTLYAFIGR